MDKTSKKKIMRRLGVGAIFLLLVCSVYCIHYIQVHNILEEKPSNKWSYSKAIEDTESWDLIFDMVDMKENIYVVNYKEDKSEIIELGKDGSITKRNEVNLGKYINGVLLLKDENEPYLVWTSSIDGKRAVRIGHISKLLEIEDIVEFEGYEKFAELSKDSMLLFNRNSYTIYEAGKGEYVSETFESREVFSGDEYKGKYYIGYLEEGKTEYICDVFDNRKIVDQIKIGNIVMTQNNAIDNMVMNADHNSIDLMYENYFGGKYQNTQMISCDLATGDTTTGSLESIRNLSKADDGKIYGKTYQSKDRRFGMKNIVEYEISEAKVKNIRFASNTVVASDRGKVDGKYIVFSDYGLRIATSDKSIDFYSKGVSKSIKDGTKFIVAENGMTTAMFTVSMMPLWLGPLFFILFIIFWMDEKIKGKARAGVIITLTAANIFYQIKLIMKHVGLENGFDGIPSVGVCALIITILMVGIAASVYKRYVKEGDATALAPFFGRILLEEIVVMALFWPFI